MTSIEILQYVPFFRVFIRPRKVAANNLRAQGTGRAAAAPKKSLLISVAVEGTCLLILYLLLCPALAMPLYNAIIFHPIAEKDDLRDQIESVDRFFHCTFREVDFKAPDGERLHGWYFLAPKATKTILVSHGNGGCIKHRLALCPLLLQSGCSVFMYDYEGFGDSTGTPTLPRLCDDAVAAFDYLTSQLHVKRANVILYGESIGAGVTAELSSRRAAGAIILQSPFTSLQDVGADLIFFLKLYPEWAFPSPKLSTMEIMKKAHPPLLIIHGMKDDMLPYRYSQRIMAEAAAPKQLLLLPNAGHIDVYKVDVNLTMPTLNNFIADLPRHEK